MNWCGTDHLPAPLDWPPRSPDLSSCDNALWGFIKQKVAATRYETVDKLKDAIRCAFTAITPAMLNRIILCHENDGVHTDTLE